MDPFSDEFCYRFAGYCGAFAKHLAASGYGMSRAGFCRRFYTPVNEISYFSWAGGDAGRFAAALERLLRDPDLVARLGAAARRRAEERFSLTRQVDGLLGLWAELAGVGARR